MNYIQKIVEDFNFNSIQDNNDKGRSFAENVLGVVDLGLPSGLLWCKCNLGAENEYEYGDFYAWGELTTKDEYTKDNYTYNTLLSQLPPEYDVATQTLGKNYFIPTKEQCEELIHNTKHKYVKNYKYTGINGYLFIGKNGNTLFIPAAGYKSDRRYDMSSASLVWTSNYSNTRNNCALYLICYEREFSIYSGNFYYGQSIRPVFKK